MRLFPKKINEFARLHSFFVVTGREEKYMRLLAPNLKPTGWVLENGALLILNQRKIINAPEDWFVTRRKISEELTRLNVSHSLGEVIIYVNSWRSSVSFPEARIERNREDVMILPKGVDKGTGFLRALKELNLRGKVVAVGDAENDEALFRVADVKVAVGNAVPFIMSKADLVMEKEDGEGVEELLDLIISGRFPYPKV